METKQGKYRTFVTFGQDHIHKINGIIIDYNCIAVIHHDKPEDGRDKAFEFFGPKFCFEYQEEHFDFDSLNRWFPRGLIEVN